MLVGVGIVDGIRGYGRCVLSLQSVVVIKVALHVLTILSFVCGWSRCRYCDFRCFSAQAQEVEFRPVLAVGEIRQTFPFPVELSNFSPKLPVRIQENCNSFEDIANSYTFFKVWPSIQEEVAVVAIEVEEALGADEAVIVVGEVVQEVHKNGLLHSRISRLLTVHRWLRR